MLATTFAEAENFRDSVLGFVESPADSQVTVAAGEYGADEKYSATGATLSTLCSFITIPILMVLLG